jgi:hypothetical protein
VSGLSRPVSIASSRTPSETRRAPRTSKRLWQKIYNHAQSTTTSIARRIQGSRFHGWQMGVLLGSCTFAVVLCCNISLVVAGIFRHSGYDNGGFADLIQGGEESIERWNTVFHVFINALSTILLASSNYTMQVMSSPTRSEIDRAHSQGQWLDIGLLSPRNLGFISRRRAALCIVLAVSSIPLHLW